MWESVTKLALGMVFHGLSYKRQTKGHGHLQSTFRELPITLVIPLITEPRTMEAQASDSFPAAGPIPDPLPAPLVARVVLFDPE